MKRIRNRWRRWHAARPDGEHEMALNRLLFGVASTFYAWLRHYPPVGLAAAGLYLVLGCAILVGILARHRHAALRRQVGIVADMTIISLAMHMGGEQGSLFFPLYLWCVFGNGFRFGTRCLVIATGCAVTGFAATIATTPFWQSVPALSAGLMATLVLLPAYAGRLIRTLSRANVAARAASDAKGMFLAGISHEFRTPLNAILGSVALLEDTPLDREQRELSAALDSSTRRLLGLIDNLLDFSKLDAGCMPVETAPFALAPLLADIATLSRPQARIKRLRLGVHVDHAVPAAILADRRRLQEVLINLVGNAVKFTDSGSVTIHVAPDGTDSSRHRLRFSVVDTGIGIDPAHTGRIFDSFAQADRSILDRFGGTGLGLALCRQLVQLMGGEIGVDSLPGRGSRFWFTLDAPAVALPADEPAAEPRRLVVLVEDETVRARLAARIATLAAAAVPAVTEPARVAGDLDQATALLGPGEANAILLLQGDRAALRAADRALAACDPVRAIPCILLGDQLAPEAGAASFVDTAIPPELPAGALEDAIARVAALHPERAGSGWIPEPAAGAPTLDILVADDNSLNRQVLGKLLERTGHRAVLVSDGDQALDAMSQQAFDLVLMDVNMPVLTGLDATRLHRLSEIDGTHLPIVALTADPTDDMRARCLEAGMDQCLSKPIEPRTLLQLLETVAAGLPAQAGQPQRVAMLTEHPRFRTVLPVLDDAVLETLSQLGGTDFVSDLLAGFSTDARDLVALAAQAASNDDMPEFRNQLHALRSMSANIGARAIHQAAGAGRTITGAGLREEGSALARRLGGELDRFELIMLSTPIPRQAR